MFQNILKLILVASQTHTSVCEMAIALYRLSSGIAFCLVYLSGETLRPHSSITSFVKPSLTFWLALSPVNHSPFLLLCFIHTSNIA